MIDIAAFTDMVQRDILAVVLVSAAAISAYLFWRFTH